MAEHGGNLSEAMQAREAAILREQGVTQPWEGDGHMHTGTLADGVGGMQDRELRILMERGAEQLQRRLCGGVLAVLGRLWCASDDECGAVPIGGGPVPSCRLGRGWLWQLGAPVCPGVRE